MSFGQSAGPPASAKQKAYLESLLRDAGYDTFREARHPLGLTQRQAGGRFTKQEASALIDQLLATAGGHDTHRTDDRDDGPDPDADRRPILHRSPEAERRALVAAERLEAERAEVVRGMPAEVLADELVRRGWGVSPPPPRP